MFQPIPDACPVPRGVVALIGGYIGDRPMFALWRDGEQIIIEAAETKPTRGLDSADPYYEWNVLCEERRIYANYLEIIQSLLLYINFGGANWGYLRKDRTGQYFIQHRQRITKSISCPLWATLIPEHEVEFTVWGTCADRRGIWRKKKVDVHYGWNDTELWALDRSMIGYRAAQRLDLTYEVYGHLVGKDGTIIGLVSEAATGRMIRPSDKALVFMAISKLQSAGCLYRGCITNRFMIQDNIVRLLELNCIVPYKNREKLARAAERWHWDELEQLFQELRDHGEYGYHRNPPLRFTTSWKDLDYILPKFSPERPVGGIMVPPRFFASYFVKTWDSHRLSKLHTKSTKSRLDRRLALANFDSDEPPTSSRKIHGPSNPARTPRSGSVILSHHPYRRVSPPPQSAPSHHDTQSTVVGSADSKLSSDTHESGTSSDTLVSKTSLDRAILSTFSGRGNFDIDDIPDIFSPAIVDASDEFSRTIQTIILSAYLVDGD